MVTLFKTKYRAIQHLDIRFEQWNIIQYRKWYSKKWWFYCGPFATKEQAENAIVEIWRYSKGTYLYDFYELELIEKLKNHNMVKRIIRVLVFILLFPFIVLYIGICCPIIGTVKYIISGGGLSDILSEMVCNCFSWLETL